MNSIAQCWTFPSSSGSKRYQTLRYTDGTTSCDCPGWCKRIAPNGSRSCKHTRSVLMGTAHQECESRHDYAENPTPVVTHHPTTKRTEYFGQIGRRRIQA